MKKHRGPLYHSAALAAPPDPNISNTTLEPWELLIILTSWQNICKQDNNLEGPH